jgi:membrane associated rhomboid family serine protease
MRYSNSQVKIILIINVAVFLLAHLLRGANWIWFFALTPQLVLRKFMLWQILSYAFLHLDLWHLIINMLMLWFFGPAIEQRWGGPRFLFYYLFCATGAGLCSFIVSFNSSIPVIGASGAIFGILVAYAMMFPETVILLFFIFPMKMRHAVLVLAAINLLGAISASGGGVAYIAHLGGGLFGYLYLRSEWIRLKTSGLGLGAVKLWWQKKKTKQIQKTTQDIDQDVDQILDKISKQGIGSLSRKEREVLERKSKQR